MAREDIDLEHLVDDDEWSEDDLEVYPGVWVSNIITEDSAIRITIWCEAVDEERPEEDSKSNEADAVVKPGSTEHHYSLNLNTFLCKGIRLIKL